MLYNKKGELYRSYSKFMSQHVLIWDYIVTSLKYWLEVLIPVASWILKRQENFFFPLFWTNMEKKNQGRMLYILNIQCDVLSH